MNFYRYTHLKIDISSVQPLSLSRRPLHQRRVHLLPPSSGLRRPPRRCGGSLFSRCWLPPSFGRPGPSPQVPPLYRLKHSRGTPGAMARVSPSSSGLRCLSLLPPGAMAPVLDFVLVRPPRCPAAGYGRRQAPGSPLPQPRSPPVFSD